MAQEKDSNTYETFDSGAGPVVPEGESGNFAHMDSTGLQGYTSNEVTGLDLEVPEVPAKKR